MRVSAPQTAFCHSEPVSTNGTSNVRRLPTVYSSNSSRAWAVASRSCRTWEPSHSSSCSIVRPYSPSVSCSQSHAPSSSVAKASSPAGDSIVSTYAFTLPPLSSLLVSRSSASGFAQPTVLNGARPPGPPPFGERDRTGTHLGHEHPVQVPLCVAQPAREPLDTLPVDDAVGDEPHRPADEVGAPVPLRGSRRGVGAAALAGAEPARLGCPSGRIETDVEVRAASAPSEIPQRYTVTPHCVVEGVGAWPRMAREGQQCPHPIRRLG